MTDPNSNRPLWRVMADAYLSTYAVLSREFYAAELHAIAEEMIMHFDPWLQEHADVYDWLQSEADRAEAGEITADSRFTVTTRFNQDLISQRTTNPIGKIIERVIRLQDQDVRKALIALGWTPPPEHAEASDE